MRRTMRFTFADATVVSWLCARGLLSLRIGRIGLSNLPRATCKLLLTIHESLMVEAGHSRSVSE